MKLCFFLFFFIFFIVVGFVIHWKALFLLSNSLGVNRYIVLMNISINRIPNRLAGHELARELLTQATFSSAKIYIAFLTQGLNRGKYHLSPQPYEPYTNHRSPSKICFSHDNTQSRDQWLSCQHFSKWLFVLSLLYL